LKHGRGAILSEIIGMKKSLDFFIITFKGLWDAHENIISILQKMTFDQSNSPGR
jgi:hypothetical protein